MRTPSTRPSPWGRLPLFLLMIAALLLLVSGTAAAAPTEIVAVAAGPADGQLRLTIDVRDAAAQPPASFSAAVGGVWQPGRTMPVMSDRLALALVVDASEAGRADLQTGLSGAANFLLTAAPATRSALVADTTPPGVLSPIRPGPVETLRALTTVTAGGDRRTSQALDLAVQQFPAGPSEPRLLVLYTAAPDAGGEPAAALGERLRTAGVLLAVVTTAAPGYWSAAATATGGVAVGAGPAEVVGAFDELSAALRTRYLMTVPAPARLPAAVTVRVDTGNGPLTTEAQVPATPVPGDAAGGRGVTGRVLAVVVLVALVVVVATRLRAMARRAAPAPDADRPAPDADRPAPEPAARAWNIPAGPDEAARRGPLLAAVRATLQAGERVVLHSACAGAGRTTAMIEFARHNSQDYDIAWWVPAEDLALVPDRMAVLAESVGLATTTDSAEVATARLLEALKDRKRWLIVFDDAENPRELARFLPTGPGHVVVISQDPDWRDHATVHTVEAFTRDESVAVLRRRLPGLDPADADRAAAAVGDLPLDVDPVGALLADTGMGVDEFLALLPGAAAGQRSYNGAGPEPRPVGWAVAVDRLAADDPPAAALLMVVAWLGPEPVPLSLFTRNPDALPEGLADVARDPSRLAALTALLHRRRLARVSADSVQMHRATAALLVARTGRGEPRCAERAAVAVRLLRAGVPGEPATDPATWPAWRQLLPLVLAVTDPARPLDAVAPDVGWLLGRAGIYLHARGGARAARALFEDAYDLYRRCFGEDHPDTLVAAWNLEADLRALGRQEARVTDER